MAGATAWLLHCAAGCVEPLLLKAALRAWRSARAQRALSSPAYSFEEDVRLFLPQTGHGAPSALPARRVPRLRLGLRRSAVARRRPAAFLGGLHDDRREQGDSREPAQPRVQQAVQERDADADQAGARQKQIFAAFFPSPAAFREAAFSAFPDTLTLARCFLFFLQVLESVEEGDYQVALPTLSKAFAIIDKNVKRGIVHKNTAARKKSQLHLKVKKLEVRVPGELPPANLRSLCLLCL